tara:strand:- start:148 stop:417 length:270 start_codon:yes stop_codon:yes gene_type:complete
MNTFFNLNKPRAKKACWIILNAVEAAKGTKGIDRNYMIQTFKAFGYVQHLAERAATALIEANTDINHWSRWQANTTEDGNVFYLPCSLG